jgi:hypothetical protein
MQLTEDGVSIHHRRRPVISFRWQDVGEIVTFKRDFFTWDDIRLAFHITDGWVEMSEQWDRWTDVCMEMARRFPTIPERWYFEVMLPPFETCYRTLYRRTDNGASGTASPPRAE